MKDPIPTLSCEEPMPNGRSRPVTALAMVVHRLVFWRSPEWIQGLLDSRDPKRNPLVPAQSWVGRISAEMWFDRVRRERRPRRKQTITPVAADDPGFVDLAEYALAKWLLQTVGSRGHEAAIAHGVGAWAMRGPDESELPELFRLSAWDLEALETQEEAHSFDALPLAQTARDPLIVRVWEQLGVPAGQIEWPDDAWSPEGGTR